MATWYHLNGETVTLTLHIQPGAKCNEIVGIHGDALKIKLKAPPIEGRANKALLLFIAELFKVPVRKVSLIKGDKSRYKMITISGSTLDPDNLLYKINT